MALTGAIFGDKCYPSQSDALDAYYSNIAPAQTPGSTSYVNEFLKSGGVWYYKQYSVSSAGVFSTRSTTAAPAITFPVCDPAQDFLDGMAIGWGVATAIVAVAAVVFVNRGARGG